MKNIYKIAAMISAIIAAILMLIGIITVLANVHLVYRPSTFYYSAMNFILFAIFLFLAHAHCCKEKPPVA
jgi:hypothetical protein